MDDDMEAVEIVFAQRLASGEPNIRKRALKLLREHITEESTKKGFTGENLARLCKGLHYALWMQDKMILQEELADQICELTTLFQKEDDVLAFAQSLFFSLSKEWPFIDRWRMDKFLMFVRRLVRTLFARLSYRNWNPDLSSKYLQSFKETMLSDHSPICESLKFHCASLWLDELDNASVNGQKLGQQQCLDFIRPYIELLKNDISDTFFRTICTDIFDTILLDFSGQLAQKEAEQEEEEEDNADEEEEAEDEDAEEEESTKGKGNEEEKVVDESNCAAEDENEENSNGLTFDFGKLSELLLDTGKQPNVPARRRKRLYALCKKFENAAKEIDPFPPLEQLPRKRRKAGRRFKK